MALNLTRIEWIKNPDGSQGFSWNPITGCLNHVGGMCKGGNFPCYAYKLAKGRLRTRYLANKNISPIQTVEGGDGTSKIIDSLDPFYPRFWFDRLVGIKRDVDYAQTRRWGSQAKARGIFVCDMSDLFGIGIPDEWTQKVVEVIKHCPNDRFYLLTKQPQNLAKFSPFPDNCWVGVTITTKMQHLNLFSMYADFGGIEAKVKYVSLEPLLENIYFHPKDLVKYLGINWVIIGSQTKPYKPPKIEWVEEIVRACDKAGIPVFLKDNLKPLFENLSGIPQWAYSSKTILRQELPK